MLFYFSKSILNTQAINIKSKRLTYALHLHVIVKKLGLRIILIPFIYQFFVLNYSNKKGENVYTIIKNIT